MFRQFIEVITPILCFVDVIVVVVVARRRRQALLRVLIIKSITVKLVDNLKSALLH
jgi:hypothetical protein